jgi:hypothetical protein
MICFIFKLQLKFIKNKDYSAILVNSIEACTEKYIKLHLKFRNKKHYCNSNFAHMVRKAYNLWQNFAVPWPGFVKAVCNHLCVNHSEV